MIRQILLAIVFAGCLCGCKKQGPYWIEVETTHYDIARYVEGDMKLVCGYYDDGSRFPPKFEKVLVIDWEVKKQYTNPMFTDMNKSYLPPIDPADTERFLEISERNGDYLEKGIALPARDYYNDMVALSDNFSSLHVVSDTDWDEAHPAGTLLDDILEVDIRTFAELLNYPYFHTGIGFETYTMRMDELTPEYLRVIMHIPDPELRVSTHISVEPTTIHFLSEPDDPERERLLTVTMTTTEGVVKSASIKYPLW